MSLITILQYCVSQYQLPVWCMVALSGSLYSYMISSRYIIHSILRILIRKAFWLCHSSCQAVRQKRKKRRKIHKRAERCLWLILAVILQQNNNCDIFVRLSGKEVWSGDNGPKVSSQTGALTLSQQYNTYDSHRLEDRATYTYIPKYPPTQTHSHKQYEPDGTGLSFILSHHNEWKEHIFDSLNYKRILMYIWFISNYQLICAAIDNPT